MISNDEGVKVSAKIKAKIELKRYLEAFDLERHCPDFNLMKKTEPTKVQGFVDKIREGLYKKLVVK